MRGCRIDRMELSGLRPRDKLRPSQLEILAANDWIASRTFVMTAPGRLRRCDVRVSDPSRRLKGRKDADGEAAMTKRSPLSAGLMDLEVKPTAGDERWALRPLDRPAGDTGGLSLVSFGRRGKKTRPALDRGNIVHIYMNAQFAADAVVERRPPAAEPRAQIVEQFAFLYDFLASIIGRIRS
jgi:hypothetical protein